MGRYIEVGDYKKWSRNALKVADNSIIENSLAAAEMSIDNACGRRIALADEVATARVFPPHPGSSLLHIDDCTVITLVSDNGMTIGASSYQLEPLNGLSSAGEQVPYTDIRLRHGARWSHCPKGEATVTVTAHWGWPDIPPQIMEACRVLTKAHLDGRDISLGIAGVIEGAGAVSEREARVVRQAIIDYRRAETVLIR